MFYRAFAIDKDVDKLTQRTAVEQIQRKNAQEDFSYRLKQEDFTITSRVSDVANLYTIYADENKKKFIIKSSKTTNYDVYEFSELIDF